MAMGVLSLLSGLMTALSFGGMGVGGLAFAFVTILGISVPMSVPKFEAAREQAIAMAAFDVAVFETLVGADETEQQGMEMLQPFYQLSDLLAEHQPAVQRALEGRLVGETPFLSYPSPAQYLLFGAGVDGCPRLVAPEVLSTSNGRLTEVLEAFVSSELALPSADHDRLLKEILAQDELDRDQLLVLDQTLILLARRGPSVRSKLLELREDPRCRLGALQALCALAGVPDPWDAVLDNENPTEALKAFTCLEEYANALEWGGHMNFFSSPESREFPAALRALKSQGYQELFSAAREASLILNPEGWFRSTARRAEEVAGLSDEQRVAFLELDRKVAPRSRMIQACAFEVALANIEEFGGEAR